MWSSRLKTPPPRIEVLFHEEPVARLTRGREGRYVFEYLPAFEEKRLAALPGLPFGREHTSIDLFPFFEERIPELCRPEVLDWLRRHDVKTDDDRLKLLGTLGKKSVTDSFELRWTTAA
jgi:HipA N-terminal domain